MREVLEGGVVEAVLAHGFEFCRQVAGLVVVGVQADVVDGLLEAEGVLEQELLHEAVQVVDLHVFDVEPLAWLGVFPLRVRILF